MLFYQDETVVNLVSSNQMSQIIYQVLMLGIPGLLSFTLLKQTNLISISNNSSDNKLWMLILTILDVAPVYLVWKMVNPVSYGIVFGVFLAILYLFILNLSFIPLVKGLVTLVNLVRSMTGLSPINLLSTWQLAMTSQPGMVYIFDFNSHCVTAGQLKAFPNDIRNETFELLIDNVNSMDNNVSEKQVLDMARELEGKVVFHQYINIEQKVKIFIFLEQESRKNNNKFKKSYKKKLRLLISIVFIFSVFLGLNYASHYVF